MLNPRKEPQAKPVRIRIEVGGEEHSSIKSLKEKFDIIDVLRLYHDGSLLKWLNDIGENNYARQLEELKANNQDEDKKKQIFEIFKLFFPGTYGMDYSGFDELKNHLQKDLAYNPRIRPVDNVLKYMFDESKDSAFVFNMYSLLHNDYKYRWGRWFSVIDDATYKKMFTEKAISYSDYDEVFTILCAIENPTKDDTFTTIMEQAKEKASENQCQLFLSRICERLYSEQTKLYWDTFFKSCSVRGVKYDYARIIFRKEQIDGNFKARAFLTEAIDIDKDLKKFMSQNFPVTNVKEWIAKTIKDLTESYSLSGLEKYLDKLEEKYREKNNPYEYSLIKMIWEIARQNSYASDPFYMLREGEKGIKKQFAFLKTELLFWTIVLKSWSDWYYNTYNYGSGVTFGQIKKTLKNNLTQKEYTSIKEYPMIKNLVAGKLDKTKILDSKKHFFEKMFDNNPSLYSYFDYE